MCPISCRFDTASTKCSVFIFVLSNISAYLCISVFIFILSNTSVYIQISVYRLEQYWANSRQCGFQPTAVRKIRSLKAENEFNGSTEGDFFSHQNSKKDMAMENSFFRPQGDLSLCAVRSQFCFSNMCNCAGIELQKPHQKNF